MLLWNMRDEQLLSKMIGHNFQESYREPMVLNHDKNLAVLHDNGLDMWQLESPVIQNTLWDLSQYARMYFLEDGEHLIIEFEKKKFFLIEVDTFRVVKEYRLPSNASLHFQLMNGDLLVVLKNEEYDPVIAEAARLNDDNPRNKESLRDIKIKEEFGTGSYDNSDDNLKSQLRSVIAKNKMMKKDKSNVEGMDNFPQKKMVDTDTEQEDRPIGAQDTNNPRDKRETIMGNNQPNIDSSKADAKKTDLIQLEMEEIEDDEDIVSNYNINSAYGDTALSKYTNSVLPSNQSLYTNLKNKKGEKGKRTGKDIVGLRVNGEVTEQQINKRIYKYRLVLLLMERYVPNDPEEKGIYTLFQTNSSVMRIFSELTEIEKDENAKGVRNEFKKMQSRIKASSPLSGNRVYKVMLGLENNSIFAVDYHTSKYSIPIENKVVAERMFRTALIHKEIEPRDAKNINKLSISTQSKEVSFKQTEVENIYETNPQVVVEKSPYSSSKTLTTNQLKRPNNYLNIVKACRYYHNHQVMVVVTLTQNKKSKKLSLQIAGQYKMKPYVEIRINFDQTFRTGLNELYELGTMWMPKKKHKDPEYRFFVFSNIFIATFRFHLKSNTLEFEKFLKKESSSNLKVQYSQNRKLFYVPINSQILIYDQSLTHFIYRVETNRNIDETILEDDQNLMFIYDRANYYELDLDELKFKKTLPLFREKLDNFQYLLNVNLLSPSSQWNATFYTKNKHSMLAVPFKENLDLRSFPFEDLLKCFLKKNYRKYLLTFAEYYFSKLAQSDRKDRFYGSLNPLLFAIYHNDSTLLEDLLDKYFYPRQIQDYVSPLEYSFAMNYRTTIKVLCDYLIRRDYFVYFSRADFKNLLKSNIMTCHKLIATIPSEPTINILPKLVYMTSNVKAIFHDYLTSLLIHVKLEDAKYVEEEAEESEFVTVETPSHKHFESDMHLQQIDKSNREIDLEIEATTRNYVVDQVSKSFFKSEVEIKSVPFKYNYDFGSQDSITFIYNYSNSENEDFILSDWREIVKNKWIAVKFPYMFLTLCYFSYMLFFLLSSVFYPRTDGLRTIALVFNIILIIYEVIQMITYFGFKPSM